MEVDNISRGRALMQTRKRLTPGSRIQLRFVNAEGEIPLTGFVLRSSISSPKGMPRYQTAVAFDSPLQVPDIQPGQAAESALRVELIGHPEVRIPHRAAYYVPSSP